jgi:hypothetical protein
MQNKSLKNMWSIIFVFMLTSYSAQCKKMNLLIMIDEEPSLSVSNFYIDVPQSEGKIYNYVVGTVELDDIFYDNLSNIESENINISFGAIIPDRVSVSKYSVNLPKVYLYQDYVIINIFNLDKKKYKKRFSKISKNEDYYVIIKSPASMKFGN